MAEMTAASEAAPGFPAMERPYSDLFEEDGNGRLRLVGRKKITHGELKKLLLEWAAGSVSFPMTTERNDGSLLGGQGT